MEPRASTNAKGIEDEPVAHLPRPCRAPECATQERFSGGRRSLRATEAATRSRVSARDTTTPIVITGAAGKRTPIPDALERDMAAAALHPADPRPHRCGERIRRIAPPRTATNPTREEITASTGETRSWSATVRTTTTSPDAAIAPETGRSRTGMAVSTRDGEEVTPDIARLVSFVRTGSGADFLHRARGTYRSASIHAMNPASIHPAGHAAPSASGGETAGGWGEERRTPAMRLRHNTGRPQKARARGICAATLTLPRSPRLVP